MTEEPKKETPLEPKVMFDLCCHLLAMGIEHQVLIRPASDALVVQTYSATGKHSSLLIATNEAARRMMLMLRGVWDTS